MAKLLDGPAALRSYLIRKFIMEEFTLDGVMADDEQLEAFVRKAAVGVWHASCSCRMGAATTRWPSPIPPDGCAACKGCAWSMRRYFRWCLAPTPIFPR